MEIKLLHLYYDIMNLYGEYGNMKILEKHLKDQGFKVVVDKKTIGDVKNISEYDFVYIGSGTERNLQVILEDIGKEKEDLKKSIENGKVVLLTGNSYEILGKTIDNIPALGILDFETKRLKKRITSDIICKSDIFENKIVGFINKSDYIEDNKFPLFKVDWSSVSIGDSEYEGILYKNLFATHIIGPILVRNPHMLKNIIHRIGVQKDENYVYKDIDYVHEQKGYELVLKELENRE